MIRRVDNRPVLRTLFPIFCSNSAIPACILALCDRLQDASFRVDYWSPAVARGVLRPYHRVPVPDLVARAWYRFELPEIALAKALERRFLAAIQPDDIAYIWPATSLRTFHELKRRGIRIVLERVNSHRANSRRVLDEAYQRLGLPAAHGISLKDSRMESEKLALADRVFCPSEYVRNSLVEFGVPDEKIFDTSYGWNPEQFRIDVPQRTGERAPVFLFVANGTVRKGLAQLLNYWSAANVRGTLRIVGPIEGNLASIHERTLARPDVEHLPYRAQLEELYREADVFVLASHEEGSPLVTYLAQAAGLPCLVSPAAAGGIVRDGVDGIVRHPYDEIGWVAALRELAERTEYRLKLGRAALEQSRAYTWDAVAERRRLEFERMFARRPLDSEDSLLAVGTE